ncbi:hypothetical protein ABIA71_001261 [Stenotrophomonas sp. 2619]
MPASRSARKSASTCSASAEAAGSAGLCPAARVPPKPQGSGAEPRSARIASQPVAPGSARLHGTAEAQGSGAEPRSTQVASRPVAPGSARLHRATDAQGSGAEPRSARVASQPVAPGSARLHGATDAQGSGAEPRSTRGASNAGLCPAALAPAPTQQGRRPRPGRRSCCLPALPWLGWGLTAPCLRRAADLSLAGTLHAPPVCLARPHARFDHHGPR